MRVIVITDAEARALIDQLELHKREPSVAARMEMQNGNIEKAHEELHRSYHYVVTRWLQEMGADRTFTR